eukprot:3650005-Lingulodinium_polyedra.AAC.1
MASSATSPVAVGAAAAVVAVDPAAAAPSPVAAGEVAAPPPAPPLVAAGQAVPEGPDDATLNTPLGPIDQANNAL